MDMPLSGMVDHSGPNLYKLPYYRVYEWLDALAPERRIPDHVERIAGKTSDEKPCLIGCKTMAARFVPSKRVFPLLYPVFDLSPTIVGRDGLFCFMFRVGHHKSDSRQEFTTCHPILHTTLRGLSQLFAW